MPKGNESCDFEGKWTMRKSLLVLHRWVALIASILVLVVAITGSILVFEGAIDRGLHPELWHVAATERHVSLDTIVAHAIRVAAGPPAVGITLAPTEDRADVVQSGATQIFVNPHSGGVLGERTIAQWNATFPRRVHVLHVTLMSGAKGGAVVAAITCAAFFLAFTGLILWWRDKDWRIHWSASWKRLNFDLHHSLGIFAAAIIGVITLSGMFMHYETLNTWMYSLDGTPAPDVPDQPPAPDGARPISLDSLYVLAGRALPGARVMFLTMPPKGDQPFVAAMRFPEDHTPGGRSRVFIDRYTGATLAAISTRQAQLGTRLGNELRSIHTGDLFGKPTEAIWFAASLILAAQSLTGALMWWNGRRGRAALARGAQTPSG